MRKETEYTLGMEELTALGDFIPKEEHIVCQSRGGLSNCVTIKTVCDIYPRDIYNRTRGIRPQFFPSKMEAEQVIFNDPATIVIWKDGTKTVVKAQEGDYFDEEMGLALCYMKKALGNKGNFNNVFKKWIPETPVGEIELNLSGFGETIANAVKKAFGKTSKPTPEELEDFFGDK